MPYRISEAQFEYEVKKSRFIAYARPIASADQFKHWLGNIKEQHPDARHWVSCCLLGAISNPDWLLLDDDGEPAGTSAKPILNVITHNDLADVGIIVVRYFGGIKLGAGGLVRAYGASATGVVEQCEKEMIIPLHSSSLLLNFEEESSVRRVLDEQEIQYKSDYSAEGVMLTLSLSDQQEAALQASLNVLLQRSWEFIKD